MFPNSSMVLKYGNWALNGRANCSLAVLTLQFDAFNKQAVTMAAVHPRAQDAGTAWDGRPIRAQGCGGGGGASSAG